MGSGLPKLILSLQHDDVPIRGLTVDSGQNLTLFEELLL